MDTLRTLEQGEQRADFKHFLAKGAELAANLPPLSLNFQQRCAKVTSFCPGDSEEWSVTLDERTACSAGYIEEQASEAGSERVFTLRHPWMQWQSKLSTITFIQSFRIIVRKRFEAGKVRVYHDPAPYYEVIIDQHSGEDTSLSRMQAPTEDELLEKLERFFSGDRETLELHTDHCEIPPSLARIPTLREFAAALRPIAVFVASWALLITLMLGPVKRHVDIFRLTRSLEGGPKIAEIEQLAQVSENRQLSLEVPLSGSDPWERRNALEFLSLVRDSRTISIAHQHATDPSLLVRTGAVRILERSEAWKELEDLIASSTHVDTKILALRALADAKDWSFGSKALQLVERVDLEESLEVELLSLLPSFLEGKDPRALSILRKVVSDPDRGARARGAAILAYMRSKGDPLFLAEELEKHTRRLSKRRSLDSQERMVFRAYIRALSLTKSSRHRAALRLLENQSWVDGDLCRLIERTAN